jgi:hypothetical protein
MKKINSKNFQTVLNNIQKNFEESSKEDKKLWCLEFNQMLDSMKDEDFFGTEGQTDPRGDQRS